MTVESGVGGGAIVDGAGTKGGTLSVLTCPMEAPGTGGACGVVDGFVSPADVGDGPPACVPVCVEPGVEAPGCVPAGVLAGGGAPGVTTCVPPGVGEGTGVDNDCVPVCVCTCVCVCIGGGVSNCVGVCALDGSGVGTCVDTSACDCIGKDIGGGEGVGVGSDVSSTNEDEEVGVLTVPDAPASVAFCGGGTLCGVWPGGRTPSVPVPVGAGILSNRVVASVEVPVAVPVPVEVPVPPPPVTVESVPVGVAPEPVTDPVTVGVSVTVGVAPGPVTD